MSTAATPSLDQLRVDIVGSFLRPPALKHAATAFARGAENAAELHALEDAAIASLIEQEEAHGLPIVSDGEFRRRHFMESFAEVAGTEPWRAAMMRSAAVKAPTPGGEQPKILDQEHGNEVRCPVTRRLELVRNAPLEEYRFAA